MKKIVLLIFISMFVNLLANAQVKKDSIHTNEYETINQFRDGYAWVRTRDEFHPNADQDYEVFYNNIVYPFWTLNSEGKILLKPPIAASRYYFPARTIWVPDTNGIRHIVPIPLDSLLTDVPIIFPVVDKDTMPFETSFIDSNEEFLKKERKFYTLGDDLYVFYHNNRNIYEVVSGYNPSPTNRVEYHRVLNPPKFVQDFIKKLKKDVLKKIIASKSIIHSAPNTPTKMYLLKSDEVEILEEKEDWLKIRYYGKTTIEGWIRKSDVE